MIGGRGISWPAWAMLWALGASGCDTLFRLDHIPEGPGDAHHTDASGSAKDDAATDAPVDGGGRQFCPGGGAPIFLEPFNATTLSNVCKPWGTAYSDPNVVVTQAGTLSITADPTGSAVGGCTMDADTNLGSSVTAVVTSVVTGGGGYNVLEVHSINYQIKQAGGLLRFQDSASNDHGTVLYDSSMKYWRMRAQANMYVGEYSTDGVTYTQFGSVSITAPTSGTIELTVGTTTTGGTGSGKFDELFICP